MFKVVTVAATPEPQRLIWLAAHQDYSANPVYDTKGLKSEAEYGDAVIKMLLDGGKGHFGCLEHPQITLNCCYYPHSVVMQARTHRIGISFDVQSFRYTSESILSIESEEGLERAFFFREPGLYTDRKGHKYDYSIDDRNEDIRNTAKAVERYKTLCSQGFSEEHARDVLPCNYRQHFIVSFNLRSAFHFLDLRSKADSQLEIRHLAYGILDNLYSWCPELSEWYIKNRLKRAKLSP